MVRMNKFFALYRKIRIYALALGMGIMAVSIASAHVIDIEFHGPERCIQDMEHQDNRGRDEYERRGNGENLNEREKQDATHYEREHMA